MTMPMTMSMTMLLGLPAGSSDSSAGGGGVSSSSTVHFTNSALRGRLEIFTQLKPRAPRRQLGTMCTDVVIPVLRLKLIPRPVPFSTLWHTRIHVGFLSK
mmetsp:Transcript_94701/g.270969  ORF Transcript_94701/g.270969 Transcript_94701/m.270969 type:complete len:100 (-) Transcript_94701:692-991(-)